MKIIKANIKDNKVFIGNDEVKNCVIFNSQKNSSGYVLANEEVFIFIDENIIKKITLPLIEIIINIFTQLTTNLTTLATSLTNTKYILNGNQTPVITNVSVDIQPLIQQIELLKQQTQKIKELF